jgi:ADP-ribosylglycohydrolase
MEKLIIGSDEYRDKVLACWYGKNIGGTLGEKWECKRHTHAFTFYEPIPTNAAPNDDLDLQLVWLKMLEDRGVDPSLRTFAEYWDLYGAAYPWNEYGFFMRNYKRGLLPPVAGVFENYFIDEEGSPIRSEIWACIHPGDPQAAARMAWKDSSVDHAGGEGLYGEIFLAALEAAAFVEKDPLTLIRIGLNSIPLSSHLARCVREAMWCHAHGLTWGEARERLVQRFAHVQPCSAVINSGFIIIGWLYGNDFGDRLCKAVNCGYDTDCTAASLGSILGIIDGMKGIPEAWIKPIGGKIVLHKFTGDCNPPKTIEELTERTIALAHKATDPKESIGFGPKTSLPSDLATRLFENRITTACWRLDIHAGVENVGGKDLWLHYGGEPVLTPGVGREVWVTEDGERAPSGPVEMKVPAGWTCTPKGGGRFLLFSKGPVADRNAVSVTVGGQTGSFTLLGPGEAKGFGAGDNVEKCPKCGARKEACICK